MLRNAFNQTHVDFISQGRIQIYPRGSALSPTPQTDLIRYGNNTKVLKSKRVHRYNIIPTYPRSWRFWYFREKTSTISDEKWIHKRLRRLWLKYVFMKNCYCFNTAKTFAVLHRQWPTKILLCCLAACVNRPPTGHWLLYRSARVYQRWKITIPPKTISRGIFHETNRLVWVNSNDNCGRPVWPGCAHNNIILLFFFFISYPTCGEYNILVSAVCVCVVFFFTIYRTWSFRVHIYSISTHIQDCIETVSER